MPLKAAKTIGIPEISLPSFLFGSPSEKLPEQPILLDPERPHDRFLTLETYRKWSKAFASGLRRNGLQTGDRVLFISGNSIAWPVPFIGTIMAGGILTGVSPALPFEALSRLAKGLDPRFVLADKNGIEKAIQLGAEIGVPAAHIYLFDREDLFSEKSETQGSYQSWAELLDQHAEDFDWSPFTSPDQLAAINYTSGSTGFSKGVMVSHKNIIANAIQYIEQQKADLRGPEHGHSINWVMWAPFYHVIGQNQFCVIAPKRGIHNYIMDGLALEPLLRYTELYKPPVMLMMPPLMIALLSHPAGKSYDLSSVVDVSVGGAPLRQAFVERFEAFMSNPLCRVIQGWGMTEITCVVANRHPSDRSTSECIGELLPNVEAKILKPDGTTEIESPNQPGELWIRSPNVAQGYWKSPEKTAATFFQDGWLRTGDFGYYDEKERFYVRDRVQDIIQPSSAPGTYVLPTDLETILLGIPGVIDVGVTSVEVAVNGKNENAPRGFVVMAESSQLTTDHVLKVFNSKVRPYEQLLGGLFVVKEIPKLPTGKVNRAALRSLDV